MYKKVLLTSAIVLPMTMTSIHAQSSQGIITASSLNARSGASTSYSIKFVLHKGDKVNIIKMIKLIYYNHLMDGIK